MSMYLVILHICFLMKSRILNICQPDGEYVKEHDVPGGYFLQNNEIVAHTYQKTEAIFNSVGAYQLLNPHISAYLGAQKAIKGLH